MRDVKKPDFVEPQDWNLMLQYWETPPAIKRSKQCSETRKSQRCSYGQHSHTAGSKSFKKHRQEMADENDGIMPSMPDLIKLTHTRSDGKYVDKYSEKIVQEVYSLATQMSAPEGTDLDSDEVATPTSDWFNKAFFQHVPVVKGYRFGLGAIQYHNGQTSKSFTPCPSGQLHLQTEVAGLKETVSTLGEQVSSLHGKFDALQTILAILVRNLTQGVGTPMTTEPQQQPEPSQPPSPQQS